MKKDGISPFRRFSCVKVAGGTTVTQPIVIAESGLSHSRVQLGRATGKDSEVAITAVKPTSDVSYSLKVVHRDKKSEYSVRKWRDAHLTRFESVIALKRKLKKNFSDILRDVTEDEIEMGFIEPGHGAKGKQQWVMDTDDLRDMYKTYEGKKDIMLWVYLGTKKRPRSPDPESSSKSRKKKYDVHTHKMLEVKDIADDLETCHGSGYTPEQYSVWAHMIHLRKHQSRDHPPDKPFCRGSKKQSTPCECAQSTHSSSSTSTGALPTGISPGKHIQLSFSEHAAARNVAFFV